MTPLYRSRYAIVAAAAAGSLGVIFWQHEARRTHSEPLQPGSISEGIEDLQAPLLLQVAPNVRRVAAEFEGPPLPGGGHPAKFSRPAAREGSLEGRPLADAFPPSEAVQSPRGMTAPPAPDPVSPFAAALERSAATRLPSAEEPQEIVETRESVPTFRIDVSQARSGTAAKRPNSPAQTLAQTPAAKPPANRSPGFDRAMAAVSRQADEHTAAGFRLASKGALFAARAEMIQALRLLAQALDALEPEQPHSQSLAAGLRAIKEAADFAPRGARLEADLDVAAIAAAHRSPVVNGQSSVVGASALAARQAYYTYAQEQLAKAAGGVPAGSNALYGLGRIHQAIAERESGAVDLHQPAAMVCHQAALLVEPRNYMAANELGVLLARAGQLESAKKMLQLSLRSRNQAATWSNLASVEAMRGDHELSRQAANQAALLARQTRPEAPVNGNIEWVKASEFAMKSGRDSPSPAPVSAVHSGGMRSGGFR